MKYLTSLLVVLPGTVLAHGGHGPVEEPAHSLVHVAPAFFVVLGLVAVAGLYVINRYRS